MELFFDATDSFFELSSDLFSYAFDNRTERCYLALYNFGNMLTKPTFASVLSISNAPTELAYDLFSFAFFISKSTLKSHLFLSICAIVPPESSFSVTAELDWVSGIKCSYK